MWTCRRARRQITAVIPYTAMPGDRKTAGANRSPPNWWANLLVTSGVTGLLAWTCIPPDPGAISIFL